MSARPGVSVHAHNPCHDRAFTEQQRDEVRQIIREEIEAERKSAPILTADQLAYHAEEIWAGFQMPSPQPPAQSGGQDDPRP